MSFAKIELQLADLKRWKQNIAAANPAAMSPEDFQAWVVSQLLHELAPLMEAGHKATTEELLKMGEDVEEVSSVVDEMIEHTESFIQEEMAVNLTSTLELGVSVCEMALTIDNGDDLAKKKLADAVGQYLQAAVIMIEQVRVASEDDEDEDEDSEGNEDGSIEPAGERSGLHDEGGDAEGTDRGGEGSSGDGGSGGETSEAPSGGGE